MKKTKKNKAGKRPALLAGAIKSLQKLRKVSRRRLGGLSPAQKVMGGTVLVALGLSYLAKRLGPADIPAPTDATTTTGDAMAAEESLAAMAHDQA